jgi:hypothetical protein
MADEYWFTPEQRAEMARPTMDSALEALEAENYERVASLCESMKHEWRFLHDLMSESLLALLTYIGEQFGEERVGDALSYMTTKVWRPTVEKIMQMSRRDVAIALAATWRAHSCSGTGPVPGKFSIEEDDEKITFILDPSGSCGRLWRRGLYGPPKNYGMTEAAHDWSFHRKDFPYYCAHCSFMNESLPIEWTGVPLYPLDPPASADQPCYWYLYKDPWGAPERFYARYGKCKADEMRRFGVTRQEAESAGGAQP